MGYERLNNPEIGWTMILRLEESNCFRHVIAISMAKVFCTACLSHGLITAEQFPTESVVDVDLTEVC